MSQGRCRGMSIIRVDNQGTVLGHQIEFNSLQVRESLNLFGEISNADKHIVGSQSRIQYQCATWFWQWYLQLRNENGRFDYERY